MIHPFFFFFLFFFYPAPWQAEVRTFVNGEYNGVFKVPSPMPAQVTWSIGGRSNGEHDYDGGVVSVMLYNRILGLEEIQRIQAYYGPRLLISSPSAP